MPNAYMYVLHFRTKLHHAQHYVGCTTRLQARLAAHAWGNGSQLCRALWKQGIEWQLGNLYQCTKAQMRRLERSLKNQKHAHRYCLDCCTAIQPSVIPGTKQYPIGAIPFPTDSASIRRLGDTYWHGDDILVRLASPEDSQNITSRILDIMSADKDALGFIPAGGDQGIAQLIAKQQIATVQIRDTVVGYSAFTFSREPRMMLNIHQCAVVDDARLMGNGRRMIECLEEWFPGRTLTAKVRDDLAANEFWMSCGFALQQQTEHKTSRNLINTYYLQPQQEEK
jgi:predicted GIY-YIG superfamily endonuclease